MPEYVVGVIGTGNMGSRHGEVYATLENCALRACADLDVERARAFAERVGIDREHVYEGYGEMFGAVDLDYVSVATPIPTHADVVLDCLELGDLAGIHCEKPMTDTWGGCRLMAQECARRDVQLTFNHQLRWDPPVQRATELLDSGEIGELRRVEASRADIYEAGTHQIDLCSHFAGDVPAEWVLGNIDYREEELRNGVHIEDQAVGVWQYENGVHGIVSTGAGADAIGATNRLLGTEGVIEVGMGEDPLRIRRDGEGWESIDPPDWDRMERTIGDAIDCLDSEEEPITGATNALIGTEIIYSVWESARQRGRIDLPLTIEDNPVRSMIETGALTPE